MFKTIILCCSVLLSLSSAKAAHSEVKKLIEHHAHEKHIPCFVAGYALRAPKGGQWAQFSMNAPGYADLENRVPCSENVMLRVASVSKPIESILTAKFVENGTLDWDADIRSYIGESIFPIKIWNGTAVKTTLRQLILHLSGIRGTNSEDLSHFWGTRIFNTTGTVAWFAGDPLQAEPETKFIYSNNGINLIAAVIENLSNRSYHLIAKDYLRGLGLKAAQMDNPNELIHYRGSQYRMEKGAKVPHYRTCPISDNLRPFPHWPAGGIISNIADLLQFGKQVTDMYHGQPGSFLKSSTLKAMWNYKTDIGASRTTMVVGNQTIHNINSHHVMGWVRYDFPEVATIPALSNTSMFLHTGSVGAASALLAIMPERNFTFSAISNVGGVSGGLGQLAVNVFALAHSSA